MSQKSGKITPRQFQAALNAGNLQRAIGRARIQIERHGSIHRQARFAQVPHPEIDYVLTGAPGLQTQLADGVEDVGWQPLDSWEVHIAQAISFNGRPPTPLVGISAKRNGSNVKPAVGFTLASAGLSPAPSIQKDKDAGLRPS